MNNNISVTAVVDYAIDGEVVIIKGKTYDVREVDYGGKSPSGYITLEDGFDAYILFGGGIGYECAWQYEKHWIVNES